MLNHTYVPGKGNPNAKILIVGEAPSYEEVRELTPFVGPSGRFLNALLADAGINRNDCWVTNACKYMVPPNAGEKLIPFKKRAEEIGIDLDKQYDDLRREILTINPNIIIALGGTALWALARKSPITSWRGSIVNAHGIKTIGTYHPAHILRQSGDVRGFWNKPIMIHDLKRAYDESRTKEFKFPQRMLHVVRSVTQFVDFTERYKNHKHPAIDIEAFQCIPICIGIAFTPSEGITVPLWNTHGISKLTDGELVILWRLLAEFLAKQDVVGQNFGYDRDKIKRLGFKVNDLYSDTLFKAFCIHPELPKNLAFLTSLYTKEPFYKDEGMYEGKVEDLLLGCARDACCTKEVDIGQESDINELGVGQYYRNFMLPLHSLYHYNDDDTAIEQVGFRVDEDFRKELIHKYIKWDEEIRHELYNLTGKYVNVMSPKQVGELLYDDFKIPRRKGTGEEVLTQILQGKIKNPNHIRCIELILEGRRVRKTTGSYLYALPDFDGRMRTSYFLCLDTGRSATSMQDPPIRPDIEYKEKSVKKKQSRGMAFQTITKHGDIGQDIRKILVPDEGHVFVGADLSQAEARVIFLLAQEDVRLFDEHDLHALTASWFFGGTEHDHSKKVLGYESPIRFAGKTLRHAGHLGASKKRAALTVNTDARKNKIDYRITEAEAERALKIFHAKQPNIRGVFHESVKACLRDSRRLVAPVPYGIDAKVGGTRTFFEREGDELYRQAFSYLPQRTVSEATKGAALRIRRIAPEIKILVESHDALLVMVRESEAQDAAKLLRQEMERPIDFSTCCIRRGVLTIPSDVEFGYNYKDLKKFKFVDELTS
jgi:uracil-DNA glycosylase family 4